MRLTVLNFHGLGEPHARVPADEHRYWLDHAAFDALLDRIWLDPLPRRFAFTFDDGNKSDLLAAEKLARRDAVGRFFVLAGRLGEEHYLSAADLGELRDMGMIVGLHGRDHVDWSTCSDDQLASEIGEARQELEAALGSAVNEVAIPFGRYDRSVMGLLRRSGFARIHTSDGGTVEPGARIWNRNTLRSDMTEDQIGRVLSEHWPIAQDIKRRVSSFAKRHIL
jgi:peptidoglycan/xylan/chitin deacetylase (PgdA/CDA1 family)